MKISVAGQTGRTPILALIIVLVLIWLSITGRLQALINAIRGVAKPASVNNAAIANSNSNPIANSTGDTLPGVFNDGSIPVAPPFKPGTVAPKYQGILNGQQDTYIPNVLI